MIMSLICPIMSLQRASDVPVGTTMKIEYARCQEDQCAWWTGNKEYPCVVLLIGSHLYDIINLHKK